MVEMLDVTAAAKLLGISKQKLYAMAKANEIPAAKIGGLWKFHPILLEQWIEEQFQAGPLLPKRSRNKLKHLDLG